jgi:hypothetical protein
MSNLPSLHNVGLWHSDSFIVMWSTDPDNFANVIGATMIRAVKYGSHRLQKKVLCAWLYQINPSVNAYFGYTETIKATISACHTVQCILL